MSSASISASFCKRIGPVSIPLSGQKMLRPVFVSPRTMAQLIALAPRCLGNSEGWYWMAPKRGSISTFSGKMSVTKAITLRSGLQAANS